MTETLTPAEFVRACGLTVSTSGRLHAETARDAGRPLLRVSLNRGQERWFLSVPHDNGDGTTIAHGSALTPAEAARARDAIANADALLVRRCAEVVAGLGLPEGMRADGETFGALRFAGPGGAEPYITRDGRVYGATSREEAFRLLAYAIAGGAR